MATENETIADIIAEKRRRAEEIQRDCSEKMKRGEMISDCYARELVTDIRREADRLEAAAKRMEWMHKKELETRDAVIQTEVAAREAEREAHKREINELKKRVGNAAKLCEAIDCLCERMADMDATFDPSEVECLRAALAAPPRNCDRFGGDNAKLQKVYYSECGKEYDPQDPISRQAYLVGYGNWLLAPVTEKEGGAK